MSLCSCYFSHILAELKLVHFGRKSGAQRICKKSQSRVAFGQSFMPGAQGTLVGEDQVRIVPGILISSGLGSAGWAWGIKKALPSSIAVCFTMPLFLTALGCGNGRQTLP